MLAVSLVINFLSVLYFLALTWHTNAGHAVAFPPDTLQRQRARELAQTGMTVRQLADHIGVAHMAIWRALHAESNSHDR